MSPKFYINDIEFGGPIEWKGTDVELNYELEDAVASIASGEFTFVGEAATLLNDWINDGFIYEGCPYRIELENQVLFDGYIDLSAEDVDISCDEVKASIVETGSINWLNDIADSFTMESLLLDDGIIKPGDLVDIPYVISELPQYGKAFLSFFSAYSLLKDINQIVQDIKAVVAQMTNPIGAITAIISIVFLIAYIALTVVMIILLLKQMVNSLIQPIKYHKGMYVNTMFERSCEKLNMEFRSPGLLSDGVFSKLAIVPKKYTVGRTARQLRKTKKRGKTGLEKLEDLILNTQVLTNIDTGALPKTLGDLIRDMQTMYDAKVFIQKRSSGKNILYVVPSRYEFEASVFQVQDVYSKYRGTNASELNSNLEVLYTIDPSEYNTLDDIHHTHVQVITKPKVTKNSNPQFRLAKGLKSVQIPYARAIRKTDLTFPEKVVDLVSKIVQSVIKAMLKIQNALVKLANGVIDGVNFLLKLINATLPPLLNTKKPIPLLVSNLKTTDVNSLNITTEFKRVGTLLLSQDQFSVDKIMLLDNGKITEDSLQDLSPAYLHRLFLSDSNSFVPSDEYPNANQYARYSAENHPFCISDYLLLKRNKNRILSPSGEEAEIESLKWNISTSTASIFYRVNRLFTNNLQEKIIIDGIST